MSQRWFRLSASEEHRVEKPLQTGEEGFFGVDYFDLKLGKRVDGWNPDSVFQNRVSVMIVQAKTAKLSKSSG